MNNRSSKTILIVLGLYILFMTIVFFFDRNNLDGTGFLGFLGGIWLFIIGLIISLYKNFRDIGRGLMIVSLIIGIIGFGVCSATFSPH